MIQYVFREDPVTIKGAAKADPQKIGEALEKIRAAGQGRLTPKAVVEEAKNTRHPLHKFFEWDDRVAAEAFRVDQARTLIRCVRVVSDGHDLAPAFISIADKGGTSYRSLEEVLSSADLQAQALRQAERDLDAFQRRYRQFKDICDVIRQAREVVSRRRSKLESRAHA